MLAIAFHESRIWEKNVLLGAYPEPSQQNWIGIIRNEYSTKIMNEESDWMADFQVMSIVNFLTFYTAQNKFPSGKSQGISLSRCFIELFKYMSLLAPIHASATLQVWNDLKRISDKGWTCCSNRFTVMDLRGLHCIHITLLPFSAL